MVTISHSNLKKIKYFKKILKKDKKVLDKGDR